MQTKKLFAVKFVRKIRLKTSEYDIYVWYTLSRFLMHCYIHPGKRTRENKKKISIRTARHITARALSLFYLFMRSNWSKDVLYSYPCIFYIYVHVYSLMHCIGFCQSFHVLLVSKLSGNWRQILRDCSYWIEE